MKVINCTPHTIRIYSEKDTSYDEYARKRVLVNKNAKPLVEIPPSGIVLSVLKRVKQVDCLDGIPICEFEPELTDNLLDLIKVEEDNLFIVSTIFALACQRKGLEIFRGKLLTVGSPVYLGGRPVGCLNLIKTY